MDPFKSLSTIPTIIRFGEITLLLELIIFVFLFFRKRSKKLDTIWTIVIAVVTMGVTLLITIVTIYFFTLPVYNLT